MRRIRKGCHVFAMVVGLALGGFCPLARSLNHRAIDNGIAALG